MQDSELVETWQGIRNVLDVLEKDHREPNPWEPHFVAEAITCLAHGHAAPSAIAAAWCPVGARHGVGLVTDFDEAITEADLFAAFQNLKVPGGHPA